MTEPPSQHKAPRAGGGAYVLVANPAAKSGRSAAKIERALQALSTRGLPARLVPTAPHGQTAAAVRAAILEGGCQCVISMGGDGTLREVAEGLLESGQQEAVPLAMLPAGTANNHARSFGLSLSDRAIEQNIDIIARGRETRLDVGRLEMADSAGFPITRMVFIDSIGFGAGARVIAARNAARRSLEGRRLLQAIYRDQTVYAAATLRTLLSASRADLFAAAVLIDGETRVYPQLTELLIKGTRVYAGRWVIDRNSRHDDGMFEVVAFPNNRRWVAKGLIDLIGSDTLDRWLSAAGAKMPAPILASRLSITFDVPAGSPLPAVQVDGEEVAPAPRVTIAVLPRSLRLIVP